jgi:hypothetical protein
MFALPLAVRDLIAPEVYSWHTYVWFMRNYD